MWLVQGTGQLLAYAEAAGSSYQLDSKGKIGIAPEDHGVLTLPTAGEITLDSAAGTCHGQTSLTRATLRGTVPNVEFHAVVSDDPCHQFAGQTDLTLIRLL